MEMLLGTVTLVSLAIATGMSFVAWKVLKDGRARTLARAEALRALAAAPERDEASPLVPDADDSLRLRAPAPTARPAVPRAFSAVSSPAEPAHPRFAALDLDDDPIVAAIDRPGTPVDEPPPALTAMFEASAERRAPGRRWLALAAVGALMAVGAGGMYALHSAGSLSGLTATGSRALAAATAGATPLELLSLSNSIDPSGDFTVTGLVDNPLDGRPLHGIVAVVYLFDAQGHYFASGRAPLDLPALPPGEESPFTIRVPIGSTVSRYRIGFRLEDGGVVRHVDRRALAGSGTTASRRGNGV
jgi:hypothetical protein